MVFWLRPQVLEDALLPVPFHLVPVLNLSMLDRVVDGVRLVVGDCLVADEEVEVLDSSLGGQVA